jgi:hypothetical protein
VPSRWKEILDSTSNHAPHVTKVLAKEWTFTRDFCKPKSPVKRKFLPTPQKLGLLRLRGMISRCCRCRILALAEPLVTNDSVHLAVAEPCQTHSSRVSKQISNSTKAKQFYLFCKRKLKGSGL